MALNHLEKLQRPKIALALMVLTVGRASDGGGVTADLAGGA